MKKYILLIVFLIMGMVLSAQEKTNFINPDGNVFSIHIFPYYSSGNLNTQIQSSGKLQDKSYPFGNSFGVNVLAKIPLSDQFTFTAFYQRDQWQYDDALKIPFKYSFDKVGAGISIYFR